MLANNEGEERQLQGVAHALNDAEIVFSYVRVLWRIRYKAFVRQACREAMVEMRVYLRIGHIAWPPLQAMLTHHDGASLTVLDAFGHKQNSVRGHIGPYIQQDLVARYLGSSRIRRVRACGGKVGDGMRPMT